MLCVWSVGVTLTMWKFAFRLLVICSLLQLLTDGRSFQTETSSDKLPPIIIDGPPHQMIFKLGESTFKLNCVALRARRYQWWKDSHLVHTIDDSDDGSLLLKANVESTGYYQCYAINSLGIAVSNITRLVPAEIIRLGIGDVTYKVAYQIGNTIILPCNYTVSRPPPVYKWFACQDKMNCRSELQLSSHTVALLDSGALVLKDINSSIAQWMYRCDVFNPLLRKRMISNYVSLQLNDESSNNLSLLWRSPSPLIAFVGRNVSLNCYFSSKANLKWQINGQEFVSDKRVRLELSGSQLSISDVQPSDSGIYSCHAIRASQTLSAQIKFEVAEFPAITVAPSDLITSPLNKAIFRCEAVGLPVPHIDWLLDNMPLSDVEDVHWYTTQLGSVLYLENLPAFSSMTIHCNASNKHGYVLKSAYLVITAMPTESSRIEITTETYISTLPASPPSSATVIQNSSLGFTQNLNVSSTISQLTSSAFPSTSRSSLMSASYSSNLNTTLNSNSETSTKHFPIASAVNIVNTTVAVGAIASSSNAWYITLLVIVFIFIVILITCFGCLWIRRCSPIIIRRDDSFSNHQISDKAEGHVMLEYPPVNNDILYEQEEKRELPVLKEANDNYPLAGIYQRRFEETSDSDSGVFDRSVYSLQADIINERSEEANMIEVENI